MSSTLVALLLVAGCSAGEDLSREEAGRVVLDHLVAVAPSGLADGSWDGVEVEVEGVAAAPDAAGTPARRVTFRAFRAGGEGRGPAWDAVLARTDGVWSVVHYGDELRASVGALVAEDRARRYGDLLEALQSVQDTAAQIFRAWSRPLKFAPRDLDDEAQVAARLEELERGIPADLLRSELEARHPPLPGGLVWGVTDESPTDGAEVVWVARSSAPDTRCGQLIGPGTPPAGWSWLEQRFPTCDGEAGRYVGRPGAAAVLAEIDAAGGALSP